MTQKTVHTWRMELRQLTLNTHLGSVNICAITFLFIDQSTPTFFLPTWVALLMINYFFRLSICRSIPEIFAIKVESCLKSLRILDVFALPNVRLQAFQKLSPLHTPSLRHVAGKSLGVSAGLILLLNETYYSGVKSKDC